MKRHEALVPFSRFHRSCLFLALVAKKNAPKIKDYPTELSGKINYAHSFYTNQLKKHFEKEERLWDFAEKHSEALASLIRFLRAERKELHKQFHMLEKEPTAEQLDRLGKLLEKHVRNEERKLFQLIQAELSEAQLQSLSSFS